MEKMNKLGKIRNILFSIGIGLAVISMLIIDDLEFIGLLSATLAMISLASGLVLMIINLRQNKSKKRNS